MARMCCPPSSPRRPTTRLVLVFMLGLVLVLVGLPLGQGQLEGWRMVDRFAGFRFEVHGKVQNVGFRRAAQDKADALGCFGWVQNTAAGTLVGEARCSKTKGPLFKDWLEHGPALARIDRVEFKDYESTKIMLHFSHFKILDDSRITCFRHPPHQCPQYASRNATSSGRQEDDEEEGGATSRGAVVDDTTGIKSEL